MKTSDICARPQRIIGAAAVTYDAAFLEFDDFSVADLFHNVDMIYDASEGLAGSYTRIDGANESAGASETVYGSEGVDNAHHAFR